MMQTRKLGLQKKSDSIKEYLFRNMIESGIEEISCPYFKLSIRQNPAKVVVQDESLIPDKYMVTKTTSAPDKRLIKKDGGCTGVELVTSQSLVIK